MNSLPLCTAPERRVAEYMSLYPVILPLREEGGVQERWIALDDTVVAASDSTGPGTRGKKRQMNSTVRLAAAFPIFQV